MFIVYCSGFVSPRMLIPVIMHGSIRTEEVWLTVCMLLFYVCVVEVANLCVCVAANFLLSF